MPLKSVIKNCAVVLKCPFVIQNIDKIETLPIVGINALISSSSSVYIIFITCLFIFFFFFGGLHVLSVWIYKEHSLYSTKFCLTYKANGLCKNYLKCIYVKRSD